MSTSVATAKPRDHTGTGAHRTLRALALAPPMLLPPIYLGIAAYIADRLSHPARHLPTSTPAEYGLAYEDVEFSSAVDNIPLRGWYIHAPGDKVIVMMHGRDGVRDDNNALEKAALLVHGNYDVLMFDFRAHGLSGGDRFSMGQREVRDVEGALKYLQGRDATIIGGYALSMGGSPALYAAAAHPELRALVVDSTFADLMPLFEAELPKVSGLPKFFNPGIFLMVRLLYGIDLPANKPAEAVARLGDRPLFIIQSRDDDETEMIPVSQGLALQHAGAADSNLQVWFAPGKGHAQAFAHHKAEYGQRLLAFYDRYLK